MKPFQNIWFLILLIFSLAANLHGGILEEMAAKKAGDARAGINVLRVASTVADGETVTLNTTVFEVDTHSTATITDGHTRLNLSGGSTVAALGTLTFSGQPANTETVTVGGKVYTFQTTLTNVANNVLIGASTAASITNLAAAINAGTGSGTTYAALTAVNANVSAVANSTTLVATALVPGTIGNAITSTETVTNAAWGAGTLASGANPTAAEFTTALETTVNVTNCGVRATRIAAGEVLVTQVSAGAQPVVTTETLAGTNNVFANTAATFGVAPLPSIIKGVHMASRVPTATEITLENMHFVFNFTPVSANVIVRTSAGVARAWDGALTISGNRVDLASSGSTDISASDVVTVIVSD